MRKKIVAGNWKMNLNLKEGKTLASQLAEDQSIQDQGVEVVLIPSYVNLSAVSEAVQGSSINVGSQNNHQQVAGAFTGEVSAQMLKSVGVSFGLVGHSERREYFNEGNELLLSKLKALLAENIQPIFCCGESLEERKAGKHFETVGNQLAILWQLSEEDFSKVVIAYEPVWAIGTGETASSEQAQEIHAFIRNEVSKKFPELADSTSILYGGSCKPSNAKELFQQADVDGGLIGGASLKAEDFAAIIQAFE